MNLFSSDVLKDQLRQSDWDLHAQLYAFLGNSFLSPMADELSIGLKDTFWGTFACDGANEHVKHGIDKLVTYAYNIQAIPVDEALQRVNIEYAHLFVGPPRPAAITCESLAHGSHVGYGEPTCLMRLLLQEADLALSGPSNQYEDHIGIELLYISACCKKFSQNAPSMDEERKLRQFIEQHPLSWIEKLYVSIAQSYPDGYYVGLAEVAWGLLQAEV